MAPSAVPGSMRAAGVVLALTDSCLHAALEYSAHYYRSEPAVDTESGDLALSPESVAAACIFLASKVCEEPRRVRDCINAVHLAITGSPLEDSHLYWALKERIVLAEQQVLRSLGYDTAVEQPQILLLNFLRLLDVPRPLYGLCASLLNDAAGEPRVRLPPRALVAAAVRLGAEMLAHPLPDGWCRSLELDDEQLDVACHVILDAYTDPPREGGSAPEQAPEAVPQLAAPVAEAAPAAPVAEAAPAVEAAAAPPERCAGDEAAAAAAAGTARQVGTGRLPGNALAAATATAAAPKPAAPDSRSSAAPAAPAALAASTVPAAGGRTLASGRALGSGASGSAAVAPAAPAAVPDAGRTLASGRVLGSLGTGASPSGSATRLKMPGN